MGRTRVVVAFVVRAPLGREATAQPAASSFYSSMPSVSDVVQVEPGEGAPARERVLSVGSNERHTDGRAGLAPANRALIVKPNRLFR